MRLCGKIPVNWFPNQVRSERRSSTRFSSLSSTGWRGHDEVEALTPASLWQRYPSDTPPDLPRCRGWPYWFPPFSGVRIWFLSEDGDIIIAPAVRFDEFHGLHKHFFPRIHSKNLKGVCIWYYRTIAGILNTPVFKSKSVIAKDIIILSCVKI